MSKVTIYNDTPEAMLSVDAGVPNELPIDALTCALSRADSILVMVNTFFNGSIKHGRPNDFVIANALWSVQGDLELIRKMVDFAYRVECQSVSKEVANG